MRRRWQRINGRLIILTDEVPRSFIGGRWVVSVVCLAHESQVQLVG
jgi:hypothetical protein